MPDYGASVEASLMRGDVPDDALPQLATSSVAKNRKRRLPRSMQ